MQKEPIFIPNAKVFAVEKKGSYLTLKINKTYTVIKDLEPLGNPFLIITKRKVDYLNPFVNTQEFKELLNPFSPLEIYLRQAKIEYTTSRRESGKAQYLGLHAGNSLKIESTLKIGEKEKEFENHIVPCHFYLINDDLENIIKTPTFSPMP